MFCMPQIRFWYIFTAEYLDVEADDADGCYDYLKISFDDGDIEHELVEIHS